MDDAIQDLPILENGAHFPTLPYGPTPPSDYANQLRGRLPECTGHLVTNSSSTVLQRYGAVPPGGNWQDIPATLMLNYADRSPCHTGIYHRLAGDRPSKVIGNFRKNMLIHLTTIEVCLFGRPPASSPSPILTSFPAASVFSSSKLATLFLRNSLKRSLHNSPRRSEVLAMSSTSYLDFGDRLEAKLEEDCEPNLAKKLYTSYVQTKGELETQVFEAIVGSEPNLTDHGPRHVDNVLSNAVRLLPVRCGLPDISGRELYCLGMSILFHDAGNIYDRTRHRDRVARVYDQIRGTKESLMRERTLIIRATRAHTGKARDGTTDTLKEVDNGEPFEGESVRLRDLAAVLRLADELAEGPHRTSEFKQREGLYDEDAVKYHEYASRTHVLIDRGSGRLVLKYEIDLDIGKGDSVVTVLRRRLEFAYSRILKVNQERQYTRFYSDLLNAFTSTEASFNFHYSNELLDIDLKPLKLTDIVLPHDPQRTIDQVDQDYALEHPVPRVMDAVHSITPVKHDSAESSAVPPA